MASLAALVAGLAGSVERAAVGGRAVAGDVAQLAAGVALHGLRLAVARKMVGAAALVAGRRARAASEAAASTVTASVATSGHRGATAHGTDGVGAGALDESVGCPVQDGRYRKAYSEVTGLATVVAASAGAGSAQTEGGAVSLDVTEALAVVALFGFGGARQRAAIGLVAW